MNETISHQEEGGRGSFFINHEGHRVATMTYRRTGEASVVFDHTLVSPALRGQGVARRLLDSAVSWARATGNRITPHCTYVVAQFAGDPSIADVLA